MKIPFLGLPDHPQAKVALIPVPLELSTTWLKGTKEAPLEILKVSPNLEFFDEETSLSPHETFGFFTFPVEELPLDLNSALIRIEELVEEALKAKFFPILLGGEHTLTLPSVRAFKKFYPDLRVLHLDAHLDFREEYLGTKINHATVMRRIYELGIPILSLGIRALSEEEFSEIHQKKLSVLLAKDIWGSFEEALEKVSAFLKEGPVYLSLDMDALDPALAPGVGTPEPGGLFWQELLLILRKFVEYHPVGMDIVETRPIPGNPFTEFLVGKIILKVSAYLAERKLEF